MEIFMFDNLEYWMIKNDNFKYILKWNIKIKIIGCNGFVIRKYFYVKSIIFVMW